MGRISSVLFSAFILGALGCPPAAPDAGPPAVDGGEQNLDGGSGSDAGVSATRAFVVLHTSDEHGHLLPAFGLGAAANVLGAWNDIEAASPQTHLIVSSGDMWMGPAISTWFEGAPTIEVMNRMGYQAAALGNHDLDLGHEVLEARMAEANFPILAANVQRGDPLVDDPRFEPFTLSTVGGVTVAVVGLTNIHNDTLVLGSVVEDMAFPGYAETLETVVPAARSAGAEVIIVAAHVGALALMEEIPTLDAKVDLWLAGHSHGVGVDVLHGAPVVSSGTAWQRYSRTEINVQPDGAVEAGVPEIVDVFEDLTDPDLELAAYVAELETMLDAALGDVVGYTDFPVEQAGFSQINWVADAYLFAFPEADVALQNIGGLRATLLPGEVTRNDVLDIFPFPNFIVLMDVTAANLRAEIATNSVDCLAPAAFCVPAIAGFVADPDDGYALYWPDGTAMDDDEVVRLVTNNYLLEGGDGYTWQDHAAEVADTGLHYSQPVLDYTLALQTTEQNPLYPLLDGRPRAGLSSLEEIGFTETRLSAAEWPLLNLLTAGMREAAPDVDGVFYLKVETRQDIKAGPIVRGDALAVVPWLDALVTLTLQPEDFRQLIEGWHEFCADPSEGVDPERCGPLTDGIDWHVSDGGVVLDEADAGGADGGIRIVTTDFFHQNGYGFPLSDVAPTAEEVGISLSDSLEAAIEARQSSVSAPLDTLLDVTAPHP